MQVKLVGSVKLELRDIAKHYREVGGNPLALRMIKKIREDILKLGQHPKIAPPYEPVDGVHRYVVADGLYLAFYRIESVVEVLHIRRSERAPVSEDEISSYRDKR